MIQKKTVFILGAGASYPYGFPVGRGLIEAIKKSLTGLSENYRDVFGKHEIDAFRNQFKLSDTSSIDEFLTTNRRFDAIGRYSIVKELKEDAFCLMKRGEGAWYHYLFEKVRLGINKINLSNVNFITFNYDRSLEQYFWLKLTNDLGYSEHEAAIELTDLNVIHVHGQLGRLPWQDKSVAKVVNDYQPIESSEQAHAVASCLRIQHESHELTTAAGNTACSLIHDAEIVIFLGFGYSQENLDKLAFKACTGSQHRGRNSVITGTAFGLKEEEKLFFLSQHEGFDLASPSLDCIEFLRNSKLFHNLSVRS